MISGPFAHPKNSLRSRCGRAHGRAAGHAQVAAGHLGRAAPDPPKPASAIWSSSAWISALSTSAFGHHQRNFGWYWRAGDANAKDAEVSAVREAARLIAEDERLTPVLVPLGDGLLAAARD